MKMILAIVQADDAGKTMSALVEKGHRVTRVATEGGWLRRENVTLLLGVLSALRNGSKTTKRSSWCLREERCGRLETIDM